jgi:hypothetical protein
MAQTAHNNRSRSRIVVSRAALSDIERSCRRRGVYRGVRGVTINATAQETDGGRPMDTV